MDVVVLIKAVPGLEEFAYDPARLRMDREHPTLLANPFDARALAAALAGRQPGERITALSMGPSRARSVLETALHLGVDRAILVSDPALAGSDLPGTARVLATALARIEHDLLLVGRASTDGDAGLLGAMVAEHLGRPSVGPARSWRRVGGELEVTADTELGTSTYRLPLPSVVITGEKISKPGRVTPEMIARAAGRAPELWGLGPLGIDPGSAGTAGARARVLEAVPDLPVRRPILLRDLAPDRAVDEAVRQLLLRWTGRPAGPSPPRRPGVPGPWPEALVLVTDEEGMLDEGALPLLHGLRGLGLAPTSVSIGDAVPSVPLLARAGALHHRHVEAGNGPVDPRAVGAFLAGVAHGPPEVGVVAVLAHDFGRASAGRLAARTGGAVITEVTGGGIGPGGLLWQKPSFDHRARALVAATEGRPTVLTVRPGAWPAERSFEASEIGVTKSAAPTGFPSPVRIERALTVPPSWRGIGTRRVVVVIGRGLGGPDRIPELAPTLEAWGAGIAGTRKVVDDGWLPPALQLGLTGRYLEPEFALLLGVHGSPNHLTGISRARTLVAIDPDPSAPVFGHVDVGIVDRWEAVLPRLTRELAGPLRSRPW